MQSCQVGLYSFIRAQLQYIQFNAERIVKREQALLAVTATIWKGI